MRQKDMVKMFFGDEVKPVNLTHLSQQTGIPRSTLSYWKSGRQMSLEGAVIIAKATKMSVEDWGRLIK